MKTRPIMRAMFLGSGITLLANPLWAGGGYGHDKNQNQAEKNRTHQSQANIDRLDQQQTMKLQQALQEHGMDPGSIDGLMGPQTRQALAKF